MMKTKLARVPSNHEALSDHYSKVVLHLTATFATPDHALAVSVPVNRIEEISTDAPVLCVALKIDVPVSDMCATAVTQSFTGQGSANPSYISEVTVFRRDPARV